MKKFAKALEAAYKAEAVAFDGCHKIYFLMDQNQVTLSRSYGYGSDAGTLLVTRYDLDARSLYHLAKGWYKDSCGLRFIQSVATNDDGSDEYTALIEQGA